MDRMIEPTLGLIQTMPPRFACPWPEWLCHSAESAPALARARAIHRIRRNVPCCSCP